MVDDFASLPEWEQLLAAERHHAGHRASHDGDHVLVDLRERFDEVLAALECAAGWRTERALRPVLVLGSMDGVMTGIRQLRRTQPLETERIAGLCVPTLAEMARIKAWLLATRHTVRDYLDTVVLLEHLGEAGTVAAMREFDSIYRQLSGASPLAEVVERLASASPGDRSTVDLTTYRGLISPWNDWHHLEQRGRHWSRVLAALVLGGRP